MPATLLRRPAHIWQLATSSARGQPQQLVQQIQKLSELWMQGKEQLELFAEFPTLNAAQNAAWKIPAIQNSLKQTTAQLQSGDSNAFISAYPTCLADTFELVMHHLLQWNHRQTTQVHREFLSQTAENSEAHR